MSNQNKPSVGEAAPAFTTTNQHNETVSLTDFKGKKVILFFYPKDDTPGCTAEACNFRDHYTSLKAQGYEVLGVSIDDLKSHQKFATKYELPFQLLVDDTKELVQAYGVYGEKSMYGRTYMGTNRTTFVIDEAGLISHIIDKVDTKNASEQVLALFHQS